MDQYPADSDQKMSTSWSFKEHEAGWIYAVIYAKF